MKNNILFIFAVISLVSCGGEQWSSHVQNNFLNECDSEARKYTSSKAASNYCECTLEKMMNLYDEESFLMGNYSDTIRSDITNVLFDCQTHIK